MTASSRATQAGHTPGPWIACDPTDSLHAVRTATGRIVADAGYSGKVETDIANARLIAAAPDLLAALIAVVSVADRKTDEFDMARAAIAQATQPQKSGLP